MRSNTGIYRTEAEALKAIVNSIVSAVDPVQVWLFGSRARNTHRPDSDFDLLVVTKIEDGEAGFDHDRVYAPTIGSGVGCDVLPCRLDDFDRESRSRTGIVRQAIDGGVLLYG